MSAVIAQRTVTAPLRSACEVLGVNRSSVYARQARALRVDRARIFRKYPPSRALTPAQRDEVRGVLSNDEFAH